MFVLLTLGFVSAGGRAKSFVSYDLRWAPPLLQSRRSLKGRAVGPLSFFPQFPYDGRY